MARIRIPNIKIPKPKTVKPPNPKPLRTGSAKAPSSPLTKPPKVSFEPPKITATEDTFKKWMKKKFK